VPGLEHATKHVSVGRVEENQGVKVTVARVENIAHAEIMLSADPIDGAQGLG
jgi:hypothetical protein